MAVAILNFVRAFNDWELDFVGNLLRVLHKERVTKDLDGVVWPGAAVDVFSVHHAFCFFLF